MPVATTNGWSDLPVHPSARLVYVSASGSDSNDGLSEGAPKLTLAAAKALLRDGQAVVRKGPLGTCRRIDLATHSVGFDSMA